MDPNFEWHTREEKLLVVAHWWGEQKGRCCICDDPMLPYHRDSTHDPMRATIEHLIPRREGGPNKAGNVRLAHALCNNALGALWEMNKNRESKGLEPLSREWALSNARGSYSARMKAEAGAAAITPLERARSHVDRALEKVERKAKGVKWCAQNAISLPRGATLLPGYQGMVAGKISVTKKATKMTPIEVARWLAKQGVRGA